MPPVFTTAKIALYTRYRSKDGWNFKHDRFSKANRILNESEKLIKENKCLAREIDEQTWKNNLKSTNEIFNIKQEVSYWKNEIEKLRQKLFDTIHKLELKQQAIEYSLTGIRSKLRIAKENLYEREKCHNMDLIHDHVEHKLIALIDILTNAQRSAENTILEKIHKQIYLNRTKLYELEVESNNKFYALILKNSALNLTNTLPCFSDCTNIVQGDITYLSWLKRIKTILDQANYEIKVSNELIYTDTNISCIEQDIFNQWQAVDIAVEQHIYEIKCIRDCLQDQLNRIHENILNTEKIIEFLKKIIQNKVNYINTIQCRISFLSIRSVLENIHDREYLTLINEFHDLQCSIDTLNKSLYQEEYILQDLFHLKSTIEQDLAIKNNSLFIDEEKIIGLRRTFTFAL